MAVERHSCFSFVLNCRLRHAVPIFCLVVCIFPLFIIVSNQATASIGTSRIRGSIKRASLRRSGYVDTAVQKEILLEARAQAELSSIIHQMEKELDKEVEIFRENTPELKDLEEEAKREAEREESRWSNTPGRFDQKEKMKASFQIKTERIKSEHASKAVELKKENEKKIEDEKKLIVEQISSSLLKHRSDRDPLAMHEVATEARRRLDASNDLLHYFCALGDREIRKLAKITGKRGSPYPASNCIGSEGEISRLPKDYNSSSYFQIAIFDGHAISKDLTSHALRHMASSSKVRPGGKYQALTAPPNFPIKSFKGAAVLIHSWLGIFYKVRVPLTLGKQERTNKEGDESMYAYRKECYRRSWMPFEAVEKEGEGIKEQLKGALQNPKEALIHSAKNIAALFRARMGSQNVLKTNAGNRISISLVLMLHGSVNLRSIQGLHNQIESDEFQKSVAPCKVKLIIVLCPFDKCLKKQTVIRSFKPEAVSENTVIVETQRYGGAWDWWKNGLSAAIQQVKNDDDPIVLLDAHTSKLPSYLIKLISKNVRKGLEVAYPISYHFSPTHSWHNVYSKTTAINEHDANNTIERNGRTIYTSTMVRPGYVNRRVVSLSFSKKDGIQALGYLDFEDGNDDYDMKKESSDPTQELDPPLLGSSVSVCGRLMLANHFLRNKKFKMHRAHIPGIELHGWDHKFAEAAVYHETKEKKDKNAKDHLAARIRLQIEQSGGNASNFFEKEKLLFGKKEPLLQYSYRLKDVPFPMITPETPYFGNAKCARAADSMSFCESIGNCEMEEFALETVVSNPVDQSVLQCSANALLKGDDVKNGPSDESEMIGIVKGVNRYFRPNDGYTFSANVEGEQMDFAWALNDPDLYI